MRRAPRFKQKITFPQIMSSFRSYAKQAPGYLDYWINIIRLPTRSRVFYINIVFIYTVKKHFVYRGIIQCAHNTTQFMYKIFSTNILLYSAVLNIYGLISNLQFHRRKCSESDVFFEWPCVSTLNVLKYWGRYKISGIFGWYFICLFLNESFCILIQNL